MNPFARALLIYMRQLSEEAYCAAWNGGLEFDLWQAVVEGPMPYGHVDITDEDIATLKCLSFASGGWISYYREDEETFIKLEDWIRRYAQRYPDRKANLEVWDIAIPWQDTEGNT